jgi:hypothetical protein
MLRSIGMWTCVLALLGTATPGQSQGDAPPAKQPAKFVLSLPTVSQALADLEWVVVTESGEDQVWEEHLLPACEVFLYGVDRERAISLEWLFAEDGMRQTFQIPLEDRDPTLFREENLAPIDIESRRRRADLYELTSPSLEYEGWMRINDGYALISSKDTDVPAGLPSPQPALDAFFKLHDYDVAGRMVNTAAGLADRQAAFEELRKNMLAGITKRPDETRDAFAAREASARHQVQRLERLFVQLEEFLVGGITDAKLGEARGDFHLSALSGTELAQILHRFGAEPRYFSAVPTTDDAVLSGRLRLPVDPMIQQNSAEGLKLFRPVWFARIELMTDITAEQKAARKELAGRLLEMAEGGTTLPALDACIEVTPSADGTHTLIAAIATADGTKLDEALAHIPAAFADVEVELNAHEAGEAKIHRIHFTKEPPQALAKFYGADADLFVATQKKAIWLAVGPGAVEKLQETIALVDASEPVADGVVLSLSAHISPIVLHLDELATETDFSLDKFLNRTPSAGSTASPNPLAGIDIRGVALPALREAEADRIELHVRGEQGKMIGTARFERDILKTIGKIIAKVAEEKLGG